MDSQNSLAPDIDKNYEVLKSYENIQLSSVNNASLRDDKSNAIKSDMYITPVLDKESPQSRGIELIEKSPAEHHSRNPDTIIGGYLSFPSANKVGRENTFVGIASSASKVNTYEKLNKSTADTRDDEVYATINNENVLDSENSNAATSNRHKPYERTRQNDGNGQRRKCGKRIFVVGLVVILVLITISSVATTIFVFTSKDQGKFTTENDVTSVESSNTGLTNSIPTKPFSTSIPTTSTTKLAPEHTVAFENSSYMFNIGEKASITCDVKNMPDWKRIEIRRSDGHVIIGVNSTDQSLDSNEPHISLVADGSNFANDSATLAVVFDVVMCSDAMGEVGDIDYTCAVTTSNSTIEDMTTLTFQAPATKPSLNKPSTVRLNKILEISCSGYIGRDPDGNAATNMFLEVKFMNESEFSIYNESVEQGPVVLENCRYTQTARLIFYPDVGWNNSEVRCAAHNETDVVQSSKIQAIILDSPNTYFETTELTGIVGESVILTCIVDGVDGLTGITITKGTERIIIASYPGDSNSDIVTVITEESNLNDSSGILMINMTVQCGDDGDYFCTPSGLVNPSEAGTVLSLQWKALRPVLDPSSHMVENSDPWAEFKTTCTGEIGSQNASIYLESNLDGEFKKIELPSSSEFNLEQCSNLATIKFNNKYTANWNGTVLKCVIETEEEKLMDAEYVTIVSETFCNGHANGFRIPHPIDCRAWFTCGGNRNITAFRPNKDCQVDECYDVSDTSKCIPCDNVGKCRRDPLEEASSPTTVYFTKESETVQIGNNLQIGCILEGDIAELGATVTRKSNLLGNEHLCDVSSTGDATCDLAGIDGTASVTENNLTATITISSAGCEDEGTYYCKSAADRSLKASLTVSVTKPPERGPSLTIPVRMVLDFKESFGKISCTADVGYPPGGLQIQYSTDNFTTYGVFDIGIVEEMQEVISNCSIRVTKSYKEYTYTESWNNTDLRCAVFNHTDKSEPMQVSDTKTVTLIENPCASSGLTYEYHPVNCHYYISCNVGSPTVVDNCGETNCPNIQNSTVTPHCDGNCTTLC